MTNRLRILLFTFASLLGPLAIHAEIYKWKDEKGRIQFSDVKPENKAVENIDIKHQNILNLPILSNNHHDLEKRLATPFRKDTFVMPYPDSTIPYRFILTSRLVNYEPIDSLDSVELSGEQKSFNVFIKLTGVETNTDYTFRLRVIDAKGELLFDKDYTIPANDANSAWYAAHLQPMESVDEPGEWTFQGILNGESLFVEFRDIYF